MSTEDEYEKQRVEMAKAMRLVLDNWAAQVELIHFKANVAKARYDGLRKAGFDVGQALVLCTRQVEL